MDYARERRGSDKLITPHQALSGRYYTCPTCAADVFLRRGRRRTPHFAHRSGQGKPDCENFFPSDGITFTWPGYGAASGQSESYRQIEPLQLSIELGPEVVASGKRRRGWGLRLTVPKSEDSHGRITIDCGGGTKRTIPVSKLALGAQTYPADADSDDFGAIWASPEVRPEYRAVVEDRVRGLDRDLATFFASSAERLKPRVDRLTWGASYYVIWHRDSVIPLLPKLAPRPLSSEGSWNCAFVAFPDDEDAELKAWLEEFSGLSVVPHRRVFGLIYPPPFGIDIQGRILVPTTDRLMVGFKSGNRDAEASLTIRAASGSASSQLALEGSSKTIVNVSTAAPRGQISLRINDTPLPLLVPTTVPTTDPFPRVRFRFRETTNPDLKAGDLTDKTGLALLERVRQGQAEIVDCTLPHGVKGQLRWKSDDAIGWTIVSIEAETGSSLASIARDVTLKLNDVIGNRRYEVELDFRALGVFRALPVRLNDLNTSLIIPSSLRQRILWLCSLSSVFTNEYGVPLKQLADDEIISAFAKVRLPPKLVAQQRFVVRELARHKPVGVV